MIVNFYNETNTGDMLKTDFSFERDGREYRGKLYYDYACSFRFVAAMPKEFDKLESDVLLQQIITAYQSKET